MIQKLSQFFSFVCLCFLTASTFAQCPPSKGTDQDKLCWNLQYILYAAQTDYREFRAPNGPAPNVSLGSIKVPCQVSAWLNNVGMYICSADVSLAEGQEWYAKTIATLGRLQYLWHFKIETIGTDHFVDGGPADCDVREDWSTDDGPYLDQCPLHLQEVKQPGGTAKLSFWLNSYTSPYLAAKPPAPRPKSKRSNGSESASVRKPQMIQPQ